MPPSAEQLLTELARQRLIPGALVETLRRQVAASKKPVSSDAIAKLLVEKRHLTVDQARELLEGPTDDELAPLDELDALSPLDALETLEEVELDSPAQQPLDLAAAPVAVMAACAAEPTKQAANTATRRGRPFALAMGLAAVVLAIGGLAFVLMPRSDASAEFEQAVADYDAQNYAAAAEALAAALERFPGNPQAEEARARLTMARVLIAQGRGGTAASQLPVVEEALGDVATVGDLSAIHTQLAPLVTQLALDLVAAAESQGASEERLDLARRALALANNGRYVPGSLRAWQPLAEAEETLAGLAHQAARADRLAACRTAMEKAIASGDYAAALAERDKLLDLYPDLADAPELWKAGERLAVADAARVVPLMGESDGDRRGPTDDVGPSIRLATDPVVAGSKEQVFVSVDGSVWALDAASGSPLWQRETGLNSRFSSVPIVEKVAGDVMLVDGRTQALMRLAGATGNVQWRAALGSPPAAPPLAIGERVYAATRTGRVACFDAATGRQLHAIQLPYEIRVAPVVDASLESLYVVADRLHLFVLQADDLECRGAIYLGHDPGTITTPSTVTSDLLVVAENAGLAGVRLHAMSIQPAKLPSASRQHIELPGNIHAPPVFVDANLLCVTDDGNLHTFQSTSDASRPLKKSSTALLPSLRPPLYFVLPAERAVWVAGVGLRRFRPQPNGELAEEASLFEGSNVLAAVRRKGGGLLIVRRDQGTQSVVAAGLAANGQLQWQTPLAHREQQGDAP